MGTMRNHTVSSLQCMVWGLLRPTRGSGHILQPKKNRAYHPLIKPLSDLLVVAIMLWLV